MLNWKMAKPVAVAVAACAAICAMEGVAIADDAQDTQALKDLSDMHFTSASPFPKREDKRIHTSATARAVR